WLAEAVFPVTLDPTVITKNTRNVIQDAYTCSKEPNTVHNGGSSNIIRLTKGSSGWGQCDLYFRFGNDVLPDLKPSDIVTRATLVITTAGANYPTASFSCTLHEVTSSWTPGTLTWNNAPTCSSEGRDIGHFVYHEGDGQTHVFDVTSLVRKWYQGENYGVKLTSTTNGVYAQFRSRAHGVASQRPYIVIDYISRSGMDSYLAFDGFDMGRAGAAHVNLFNGNLVYTHQDTVTNGQRMPVSVSHAWNACFADRNWFGLGLGWSCTGNHILWKETISNVVYYAWQDGSGTIRYFVQQSGIWKEELGREWTLTLGSTEATIEDKAGTKWVFGLPTAEFSDNSANAKALIRIEDPRNNQASFATSGLSLTGITDGANRGTTIELTNGLLSGIRAPGHVDTNDKISYSYTGSKLTGITYEDALSAVYGYDAHDLLASVTGVDGLIMEISYLNNAPWRVSSITAGTGTTLGGDRQIVRGKSYAYGDNLTTVTDLMTGKSLRYHFSDAGQLVALTDELGFGLFSRFPASGAIDQPEAVSRMQKSVRSLVRNPLMRDDGTWTKEFYGATGSFSYDTTTTKFAVSSVKAEKTSIAGMLCISQTLVVLPGETATFSAWAKTSGDAQAKLLIRYNLPTDTDWHLIEGDAVSSPDDWTRLEVTFTIPAEATVGTIVGMMYTTGGIGSAWWDGAQCVHGTTPGRLNLLNNSNFTFSTADWSDAAGSGLTVHSVASDTTAPAEIGSNMVRFTGTPDGAVSFVQQINVKGSQGDCFTAGGWSQAHSVPRGTKTERYRAYIAFQNTSGGWVEGGKVLWSEGWSGWHLAAEAIIAPCDYTAIMFSIHYYDNCNEANFTGLFLHQEEFGQSFSYDSKGNIIAATDLA
ncbi:MAG: DNRLRE domain-containing protein, partial [Clostridia bacterium]|nr:DNRLRE domain-containing protein [Clostridia bacterium]